jgi:hypothetical protein
LDILNHAVSGVRNECFGWVETKKEELSARFQALSAELGTVQAQITAHDTDPEWKAGEPMSNRRGRLPKALDEAAEIRHQRYEYAPAQLKSSGRHSGHYPEKNVPTPSGYTGDRAFK